MEKSSEGEVSLADISNEELSDALADLLSTYRITRRELKRSRQENLQLVEQISLLTKRLEKASSFPTKENEYIRKLGEEITRLEMENIILKEKQNALEIDILHKEEKISLMGEYSRLREQYDQLLGSQKALEMLLGSQRSVMRKEGLGYEPNGTIKSNKGTKWVKEGTKDFFEYLEPQSISTGVEVEEKGKGSKTYLIDETIQRDPRYRYSHSYGMLGGHRIVDKLIDPIVSIVSEPPRVESRRVISSRSAPTSGRLKSVGRIDNSSHHKGVSRAPIPPSRIHDVDPYRMDPRARVHYQHMVEHPQFFHPHITPPHHMPLIPFEIVNTIPRFRLPQFPPWAPMGWN